MDAGFGGSGNRGFGMRPVPVPDCCTFIHSLACAAKQGRLSTDTRTRPAAVARGGNMNACPGHSPKFLSLSQGVRSASPKRDALEPATMHSGTRGFARPFAGFGHCARVTGRHTSRLSVRVPPRSNTFRGCGRPRYSAMPPPSCCSAARLPRARSRTFRSSGRAVVQRCAAQWGTRTRPRRSRGGTAKAAHRWFLPRSL